MAERLPVARGRAVTIEFDGRPITCHVGETVASALLAAGRTAFRRSARLAEPRGVFCNMGICYECLVYIDGRAVRSCMTAVADGLEVLSWQPTERAPS